MPAGSLVSMGGVCDARALHSVAPMDFGGVGGRFDVEALWLPPRVSWHLQCRCEFVGPATTHGRLRFSATSGRSSHRHRTDGRVGGELLAPIMALGDKRDRLSLLKTRKVGVSSKRRMRDAAGSVNLEFGDRVG